ncbi:HEAT repeat-containing protein 5B [Hypsibius exemplaris]|uniref:HEAT repeat-containing protein 5B n=1 Tax=Hypsibius exemplaris TaxID=2072580 RepID=A0A9X6RK91_HYPEX|nr:HEAT repeat-containing protein 5B [Hypsibius exemplaris]
MFFLSRNRISLSVCLQIAGSVGGARDSVARPLATSAGDPFHWTKMAIVAETTPNMEQSNSLLLNENALQLRPDSEKAQFVLEWLRHLHKILNAVTRADIKGVQKKLQEQLIRQLSLTPGPPVRFYLARCVASLFAVGDSVGLFDIINLCNDQIKNPKDDPATLNNRLAALEVLGEMYERLGRMVGRSYEDTVENCRKNLKSAESQTRIEIMRTLDKLVRGLGTAVPARLHMDIYKHVRTCMTDRLMGVREAAARCMEALAQHSSTLFATPGDLEAAISLCCRGMAENSTYDVRVAVASLVAALLASSLSVPTTSSSSSATAGKSAQQQQTVLAKSQRSSMTADEVLNLLAFMFLKGGQGGVLKTGAGEMIRGTTVVTKEVRIGAAHAYIAFFKRMGAQWTERNLPLILNHLMDLAGNPRSSMTHVDAIYARKCVSCIFQASIAGLLTEKAQLVAGQELLSILYKSATAPDVASEGSSAESRNADSKQHVLICALEQLQTVIVDLDSMALTLNRESSLNLIDVTMAIVVYPSANVQLAAAWTLRCIITALPTQVVPVLNRLLSKIEDTKTFPEGIVGYSYGMAAVIGGIAESPLGIPHRLVERAFSIAEELLRSAALNSRLSQQRTEAAWMILGAITTLGSACMRKYLSKYLLLWRTSFPRSDKEIESEKLRGDAFTWQVSLQNRAGALAALNGLLVSCPELVTEDVLRKIMVPVQSAIALLHNISPWVVTYGPHLKVYLALLRVRLYETLMKLTAKSCLTNYSTVIMEVVTDFTLVENQSNTTTSLLRGLCRNEDALLLGQWLQDTDQKLIEEQLQPNSASGSGSLEHDATAVYKKYDHDLPSPLPIGVAVIDFSLLLFGKMFVFLPTKHQQQILEHLAACIKQAKSQRQQALLINVFTALLSALKNLNEAKNELLTEPVVSAFVSLIHIGIISSSPMMRCAAGEALGRLAQVVGEPKFVAETVQRSFDVMQSSRDVVTRTGHCMVLGCLHRYVGGMASNQHLKNNIMILKALAEDLNAPMVQVWALHALYLIADSGGPMFRGYVEQTLSLCMKLLLTVPRHHHEVFHCIGKCLSALITAVGPELNGATSDAINAVRNTCLTACALMMHSSSNEDDWISQSEAVQSFQQVHMFAPRHVNFSHLVPDLVRHLSSPHLLLRQSAVDCLRQLCQRETGQVCDIAKNTQETSSDDDLWLAQVFLDMLDVEKDPKILSGIQLILQSLLQYAIEHHLSAWFTISREILTTSEVGPKGGNESVQGGEDEEDDEEEFRTKNAGESEIRRNNSRWLTRVYAVNCLRKLIRTCKELNSFHFDVMRARRERLDALILHLPDLVRMAFMGATSDSDELRMAGLDLLLDIIVHFAGIEEPEFPGHGILEQYQANVGAALRPAFASDTPPNITAKACDVCSRWIASGVARDIKDLRRVYQLLVQSLDKLRISLKDAKIPYSEASVTLEKLSILKAWAEIYVDAMRRQKQYEELLALVQPHVASLSRSWLAAIRDQALLSLPSEYLNQLPAEGGAFYSVESIDAARKVYQSSWLPILYATVTWWSSGGGYENVLNEKPDGRLAVQDGGNLGLGMPRPGVTPPTAEEINRARFSLFFGTAMEALCQLRSDDVSDDESVMTCLKAAQKVLELDWSKLAMCADPNCPKEILNIMHRIVLTRENPVVQNEALQVVKIVLQAATDFIQQESRKKTKEASVDGQNETTTMVDISDFGEGGSTGEIVIGKSIVFAAAEVFFCILIRKFPSLNPALKSFHSSHSGASNQSAAYIQLAASTIETMPQLLRLCSHRGTLAILPVILHILLTSLRQLVHDDVSPTDPRAVALIQCLRTLCRCSPNALPVQAQTTFPVLSREWDEIVRSAVLRLTDFVRTLSAHREASVTLMLAVATVILSAPEPVCRVGNVFFPCVNMFKHFLSRRNPAHVQVQTLQTIGHIFQHPNRLVASAFIRNLSPELLMSLKAAEKPTEKPTDSTGMLPTVSETASETSQTTVTGTEETDDGDDGEYRKMEVKSIDQVILVIERLKLLEMVVEASADGDSRDRVLQFVAPVFIDYLQEPAAVQGNEALARLHGFCLGRLQRMAPACPEGFRRAVARDPQLKRKLEVALSAHSAAAHRQSQLAAANSTPKTARRALAAGGTGDTPSIKLKMDFGNFAAS